MKKLYSCMLAASMALAANAQLYLVGEEFGWTPETPKEVTGTNGVYTFDVTKKFKMSTAKGTKAGDWKTFNDAGLTVVGSMPMENNFTIELKNGDADITLPYDATWSVTVDVNEMSAKFVTSTNPPSGEDAWAKLYLRGEITSWNDCDESNQLTTTDGETYTISGITAAAGKGFKIADADWNKYNYGGSSSKVELNTPYQMYSGSSTNCQLAVGGENLTFTFKLSTATLTVTGEGGGGGDEPDPDPTPGDWSKWWVNLRGEFNDWGNNGLQPGENPIVEFKEVEIGAGMFDIKIYDPATEADHYYYNSSVTLDEWIALTEGTEANKMTMPGATASSVYTVKVDVENMKMYATLVGGGEPDPDPTPGDVTYVLHGNCFGGNWQDVAMTESNGKWVLADKECQKGEFGIRKYIKGEKEPVWFSTNGDNEVVLDTPMSVNQGGSKNFQLPTGTFTFTFDPAAMTLTVTGTIGEDVEDIITYCVSGDIFGGAWTDVAMTEAGGKWTLAKECEEGEFGIKSVNQFDVQKGWYSAPADATTVELGKAMTLATSDNANFKLEEAGNYVFTLDLNAMTLTVANNCPVAVSEIEAADAEAVYYNMQGVRVVAPAEGMYVKVVNGKATKVVVK